MVAIRESQCLTTQELTEFASGQVPVGQFDSMAAHVDTCPQCQATICGLGDQPDSFVGDLRSLSGSGDAEESACAAVVERLLERHSAPTVDLPETAVPDSIGGYRVLEPVGAGGMGVVYKAQHPKLKRLVAIKLLAVQRWAGPAAVARFEREMEVSGGLDHPNIVRASDAGEESGMHYLVMDFVDGLDLSRLVRRVGPLPVNDACEIVRQTAAGLAHVHGAGLVHRDIKPSNIMVTLAGQVKILDLGLATLGEQYLEGQNNLTTMGQLMGTLDYMAPEQAADSHQIDTRADIYSLGATLHQMLTGQAPYAGSHYNSLLRKVLALANAPVPSAAQRRPEVPAELDKIVSKCLAKDPADRYSDVNELADALDPFAKDADLQRLTKDASTKPDPDTPANSTWSRAGVWGNRKAADKAPAAAPAAGGDRFRSLKQIMIAAAGFALIVLAVMVVRIATDRGELIVRSADPDARLLIRREDGKGVKELTLEKGKGKITIRSGQYAVELLSDADRMMIDKRQFIISRGDQVVLTVEQRPARASSSDAYGMEYEGYGGDLGAYSEMSSEMGMGSGADMGGMSMGSGASGAGDAASEGSSGAYESDYGEEAADEGSGSEMEDGGDYGSEYGDYGGEGKGYDYGGYGYVTGKKDRLVFNDKSYNDWLHILRTERNPERLTEAVNAIAVLGPEVDSEEATMALIQVMRAYSLSLPDSANEPGAALCGLVFQKLMNMEPSAVAKCVSAEISQGNTNSRQFLLLLVGAVPGTSPSDPRAKRLRTALKQQAPEMVSQAVKLADGTDLNVSRWAMTFAATLTASLRLDADKYEGLDKLLQRGLKSDDNATALRVAQSIIWTAPETEGLVDTLVRLANEPAQQMDALEALVRLGGSASKRALPKLLEILQKEVEAGQSAGPFASGIGYGPKSPGTRVLNLLVQFPSGAEEAIPLLRKIAQNNASPHQQQASRVLQVLEKSSAANQPHSDSSDDNPFGGSSSGGDPFGDNSFGDDSSDDPFGDSGDDDASAGDGSDPFGDG